MDVDEKINHLGATLEAANTVLQGLANMIMESGIYSPDVFWMRVGMIRSGVEVSTTSPVAMDWTDRWVEGVKVFFDARPNDDHPAQD